MEGQGYNSYIIDAPIRIGDDDFICEIVVNHQIKDNTYTYYVHEVEEKEKLRGATMPWGGYHLPTGTSKLRIAELHNAVNTPYPLAAALRAVRRRKRGKQGRRDKGDRR